MARKRDYPIIRFLIGLHYSLGVVLLLGGLASAGYLWVCAESMAKSGLVGGPLSDALNAYTASELWLGAAVVGGGGVIAFLILGAGGQLLAIQRDRAINTSLQVQLLEDILELNEEATAAQNSRVELCEGCGRLGSLHRIDSGQWVCRDCRTQLRSA